MLLSEILEFQVNGLSEEEIKQKYIMAQAISNGIFDLLCYQTKELRSFIEEKIKVEE